MKDEQLCKEACKSKRGCYGYGKKTSFKVIPCDMCKDCEDYINNKEKVNG